MFVLFRIDRTLSCSYQLSFGVYKQQTHEISKVTKRAKSSQFHNRWLNYLYQSFQMCLHGAQFAEIINKTKIHGANKHTDRNVISLIVN